MIRLRQIGILLCMGSMFLGTKSYSAKTIINNQSDWPLVLSLPYGDTIIIPKDVSIENTYPIIRPITIINYGTYTQQAQHQTVSAFINAGTLILYGSICDWPCTFINTGIVEVDDEDDVTDITEVYSCTVISGLISINNPAIGTPCDDGDEKTVYDTIVDEKLCLCQGSAIVETIYNTPITETIPTLSEWGLIILSLSLLIINVVSYNKELKNLLLAKANNL